MSKHNDVVNLLILEGVSLKRASRVADKIIAICVPPKIPIIDLKELAKGDGTAYRGED